jgi:small conductance mechanosensitive channel
LENLAEKIIEWGALYGTRVIGALLILIVGRLVTSLLTRFVKRLLQRAKVDDTLANFLATLTKVALLLFVVIAALNTLGVQTASLIAIIGAAGLAVGFALQGSLANFASGIMLIMFRPLRKGDLVEAAGALGVIREVHIFNTTLITLDNKNVTIPNAKITGDNIVNYSAEGIRRVDMVFGISYGDDVRKAKHILEQLVSSDERVLKDPAPKVAVSELGDSSVDFVVRPWVKVEHYWDVYFDLTEKVKLTFDESGVTIPFPQRDVHLFQSTAAEHS